MSMRGRLTLFGLAAVILVSGAFLWPSDSSRMEVSGGVSGGVLEDNAYINLYKTYKHI